MTEIVHPRNGDAVALQPCPAWCSVNEHFADDTVIDADDGFHHYGPEIAVPTSDRMFATGPESVVKVILKSWTHPLDADPQSARGFIVLDLVGHARSYGTRSANNCFAIRSLKCQARSESH